MAFNVDTDPEIIALSKKKEGFEQWLEKPAIKLLISMLPPTVTDVQKDCFITVIRSAFQSGYDTGSATTAALILTGVLDRSQKDRD